MANQAFIFSPGKYYVEYNDGNRSVCMPLRNARDYASIFGGTVHRHPDYPTLWQRLQRMFR